MLSGLILRGVEYKTPLEYKQHFIINLSIASQSTMKLKKNNNLLSLKV